MTTDVDEQRWFQTRTALRRADRSRGGCAAGATALLTNIFERKAEQRTPYVRVVEVGENDTDPAKWGKNWPAQYDGYKKHRAADQRRDSAATRGSEALPEEKIERDPWLKRMFLGYAFSIDYRDRRGHAYMLFDQEATKRLTQAAVGLVPALPRVGHAALSRARRRRRDDRASRDLSAQLPGAEQEAPRLGPRAPGELRRLPRSEDHGAARDASRASSRGIRALAASDAPVPALPSIEIWRSGRAQGALRPEPRRDAQRDALVRVRAVPRRVLLLDQDAAHLPLGQRAHGRARSKRSGTRPSFPTAMPSSTTSTPETGRAGAQGAASRVRALEPGHPRAQRRLLRGLPHALHARRRDQDQRSLGAQPALERQPRLPDLSSRLGGRDEGSRRRDPAAQLRSARSAAAPRSSL